MAARYNFNNHRKGDTFTPVIMQLSIDGSPQDLSQMEIACMFKKAKTDKVAALSLTIDHGIEIVDAPLGKFKINPGVVDIPVATYYYDIQFTLPSDEIKTFVEGTLIVIQDVTY